MLKKYFPFFLWIFCEFLSCYYNFFFLFSINNDKFNTPNCTPEGKKFVRLGEYETIVLNSEIFKSTLAEWHQGLRGMSEASIGTEKKKRESTMTKKGFSWIALSINSWDSWYWKILPAVGESRTKGNSEALIIAQDQALSTRSMEAGIYDNKQDSKCRLCTPEIISISQSTSYSNTRCEMQAGILKTVAGIIHTYISIQYMA